MKLGIEEISRWKETTIVKPQLIKDQVEKMANAAIGDHKDILNYDLLDLNFLEKLDKYYDSNKILEVMNTSNPENPSNDIVVLVCEFGSVLGRLFIEQDGFELLGYDPYFTSVLVHSKTHTIIPVFDWAIKKFSDYGVDDGFRGKFEAALGIINKNIQNK